MSDNSFPIESTSSEKIYELLDALQKISEYNIEYYRKDQSLNGGKLSHLFEGIKENLKDTRPIIKEIDEFSNHYDFDEKTPCNGYRSFISIYKAAVKYCLKVSTYIYENKKKLLFRKQIYVKETEVSYQMLMGITIILKKLIELRDVSDDGSLFSNESSSENILYKVAQEFNQNPFYGRSIGFQFHETTRPLFKFIAFMLASYSEVYFSSGKIAKTTNSMYNGSKYFMDPELCSQRIVNITKSADIEFLKTYWFLGEAKLIQSIPNIVGIKVQINKVFTIPPEEIKLYSEKLQENVTIPAPCTHTGKRSVHARLISKNSVSGMVGERQNCFKNDTLPLSKYLIFHVHGGGWCATSSKTHESYLREWADEMKVPIFSVDYALAPENPYPCGLEDVFYAYCWVLKHPQLLGFSGEHIVLAGDSAGANLNASCITKCIEKGIRIPDGMLFCYGPTLLSYSCSPARFLSLLDPLMSYSFIMRCLNAYAGQKDSQTSITESGEKIMSKENSEKDFVKNVYDDDQEEKLASDSTPELTNAWEKAQMDDSMNSWQTNLVSISEGNSEESENKLNEPSCSKDDENLSSENDPKSRSRTPSEDNIVFDVGREEVGSIQKKIKNMKNSFVNAIKAPFAQSSSKLDNKISNIPKNIEKEFVFDLPNEYYLSPYSTPDHILKQFPPVDFMATNFDPCLDDCIIFAKKLRDLGVAVNFKLFDDLPHGFLNFSRFNKECQEGSKACISSMKKLLKMNEGKDQEASNEL